MDAARWSRIVDLQSMVKDLPPEQVHEALERAVPNDPTLVYQVEMYLHAEPSTDQFLARFGAEPSAVGPVEAPPSREGTMVGDYVVRRRIGRGAMSDVYLGERPEFGDWAALKFLPPDSLSPSSEALLRREARTLAQMRRSVNIAHFYGVETATDGAPVLVMEHVDGVPLDEHVKTRVPDLAARLRLFQTICGAVDAAHRNLVVHSDIKPSNIVVDKDGNPKLLDFGVAFHLDVSAAQARGMTLAYASPEQVSGGTVDVTTDIYSMGVLLYELITGVSPYELSTPNSSDNLAQAIMEHNPKRPSARVGNLGENANPLAPQKSLGRGLMADLDLIVQRALAKKPDDRYESARAFADDIERLLTYRPVDAHAPSGAYKVGKFVRRHPIGVAMIAAVCSILAVFATVTKVQALRLARERDKATTVASFLVDLFRVSDPGEARGRSITAKEVLDRGAATISQKLHAEPVVEADLAHTMGQVYENLGLYADAEKLYRSSIDLRRSTLGPSHIDTIRAQASLGRLLAMKGDYQAAEMLLNQAHQAMVAALGSDHEDVAEVLNSLGLLHHHLNRWAESEQDLRLALQINRKRFGPVHERVAINLENLALTLMDSGKPQEAEAPFREALEINKAIHGQVHPAVADDTVGLGLVMQNTGRLKEAEPLLREGLDLMSKTKGPNHPDTATSMTNLGMLLYFVGRPQEGKPLVSDALAIRQRVLPPDSPDLVGSLVNLATIEEALGEFGPARQHHLSALLLGDRIFGKNHSTTATIVNNLGVLYQRMGDFDNAERSYLDALARRRAVFPNGHMDVGVSLGNLGVIYYLKADYPRSDQAFHDGLAVLQKLLPAQHPAIAITETGLARTLNALGRYSEAASLADDSIASLKSSFPEPHWRIADCQVVLGRALSMTDRPNEGLALIRTGALTLEQQRGLDDWRTKEARLFLREATARK